MRKMFQLSNVWLRFSSACFVSVVWTSVDGKRTTAETITSKSTSMDFESACGTKFAANQEECSSSSGKKNHPNYSCILVGAVVAGATEGEVVPAAAADFFGAVEVKEKAVVVGVATLGGGVVITVLSTRTTQVALGRKQLSLVHS